MNHYTYEEIEEGMVQSFEAVVTREDQEAFRGITKDENPLHKDSLFAVEKGYKDQVVFGMLTASYYSTLAGVYLPGERSLIHSVETKFLKPVYIGDTLKIEGKVTEKNDTYRLIYIKATIRNQDGVKVSKATLQVAVL